MLNETLVLLLAYLIGSIPFGLIISLCAGYGDIRKIGSGNIGATNVLRTGNKLIALLTLVADSGKVILAIIIANKLETYDDYLVGSVALLGHLFPIWLKFKGGKGVACFFGLSLYLFPMVALIMFLAWLITFALSKLSSLSAIVAAITGSIALLITQAFDKNLILMLTLIIIILFKHKDNITRLINGQEAKLSK